MATTAALIEITKLVSVDPNKTTIADLLTKLRELKPCFKDDDLIHGIHSALKHSNHLGSMVAIKYPDIKLQPYKRAVVVIGTEEQTKAIKGELNGAGALWQKSLGVWMFAGGKKDTVIAKFGFTWDPTEWSSAKKS